mmetsp:Transcript_22294/g.35949  ORF Transcript_22294/g.35949 Transcript_22294/m.35949 type:complete len:96 (+) Transcript_22294:3-290(+)
MYLLRQDVQRFKEERSGVDRQARTPLVLFAGATIADCIDVLLHFFIAFGLVLHFHHHRLAVAEELSMGCAVVSTFCAVFGEILSFKIQRKKQPDF